MPITFVAAGTVALNNAAATTLSVPYPAGIQAGDVIAMPVGVNSATVATLPPGWLAGGVSSASGGNAPSERIMLKVCTGTESGSVNVTTANATSRGQMLLFRGVDNTTPLDNAGSVTASATATTTYALPSMTTTAPGAALVLVGVANTVGGTWTSPTSPGTFTETAETTGAIPSMGIQYLIWSGSGATGTVNYARSTNVRGCTGMLALRPAATSSTYEASGTSAATSAAVGAAAALLVAAGTVAAVSGATGSAERVPRVYAASGTAAASSSATGAATALLGASGAAAAALSSSTGGATSLLPSGGTAAATSSASGSAAVVNGAQVYPAAGTVAAVSGASGSATGRLAAQGAAASTATTTGSATSRLRASGSAPAASTASGSALAVYVVGGTVTAVSDSAGDTTALLATSGTAEVVSGSAGEATVVGAPPPSDFHGHILAVTLTTPQAEAELAVTTASGRLRVNGARARLTIPTATGELA